MAYSDFSLDINVFWEYWNTIKSEISTILGLGNSLYSIQNEYVNLANRAAVVGEDSLVQEAQAGADRTSSMFVTWTSIKNKLSEWLPNWLKMTEEAETGLAGLSGLGFLFALPAWGIAMLVAGGMAALAYIVTNWQRLNKDYKSELSVLQAVRDGVITAEQASKIIQAEEGGWEGGSILQQAGQVSLVALLAVGGLVAYTVIRKK